ncbi:asparaginase domain-containing protein [Serratia ureilytica]
MIGFSASALALPNIAPLATGGTIAGGGDSATKSTMPRGKLGVEALVDAVPELKNVANVQGSRCGEHRPQDMNDQVWLTLAKKIDATAARPTASSSPTAPDTLEETAYFLDLTVKCDKPVVLVGAMRPATAMSADGPFNRANAVVTAADPQSANRGVLVAMNDTVLDARDVTKTNTTAVQTFQSPNYAYSQGYIHNGKIDYQRSPRSVSIPGIRRSTSAAERIRRRSASSTTMRQRLRCAGQGADRRRGYQASSAPGSATATCGKTVFDTATAAHNGGRWCAHRACRPAPPPKMRK